MDFFFGKKGTTAASPGAPPAKRPAILLVLQADGYDWAEIFAGCVLQNGRPIRVVQCGWEDLSIMGETHSRMEVVINICQRLRYVTP